jgi:hypothetical protein
VCQAPSRRRRRRCGSAPPFLDFYGSSPKSLMAGIALLSMNSGLRAGCGNLKGMGWPSDVPHPGSRKEPCPAYSPQGRFRLPGVVTWWASETRRDSRKQAARSKALAAKKHNEPEALLLLLQPTGPQHVVPHHTFGRRA